MSQMTIDCPSCASPLLVPEAAAGRRARCTQCDTRFVIPSVEEMLEQTVSNMVLEELDQRWQEDEAELPDATPSSGLRKSRPDYPVSSTGTVLGMPAVVDRNQESAGPVLSVDHLGPVATGAAPPKPAPVDPVSAPDSSSTSSPEAPDPPSDRGAFTQDEPLEERDYPSELRPTQPRPYLVVSDVSMNGVTILFAAEWLQHETFRSSLPIRCAFTGRGPTSQLVSRPMIFVNRAKEPGARARAIEMRYEQTVGAKHSPREHLRGIGLMEGLAEPFDRPMLYYACEGHAGESIKCQVHSDGAGGEHCEVRLRSGEVAVDWLSRVNGRCGREYAQLKTAVAHLSNDGWASLSEKTQRRLQTWCQFERGERFKLYLNDADLTAADAGLGGVVVTDRRILYHKFRRSRSISLNQDAVLHLRTDDRYARLTLESHGRLARAGKILRQEMDKLIQSVADAPRLRVVVGQSESGSS
ncbi:MAG: hypothetical protein AAGG38_14700 [Planctomycetota bacterium]